jgi:hypothetical protein
MQTITIQALKNTTGTSLPVEIMPAGGEGLEKSSYLRSFQATLSGGGTATVVVQGSLDELGWVDLATITLAAATPSDGFAAEVPWKYVRSNITAIATGSVVVTMGR